MTWLVAIGCIIVGLMGSAFFSGAETGLYCVNRLRVHLGAGEGDPRAQRLQRILRNDQRFLSVTLVGTNVMNYLVTAAASFLLARRMGYSPTDAEAYTVLIVTPILFVFGEVVPKNVFRMNADRLMRAGSVVLIVSSTVLRWIGVLWLLGRITTALGRVIVGEKFEAAALEPKRHIARLLRSALTGDSAGDDQSELVERVVSVADTHVHTAMIPRDQVVTVSARADAKTLRAVARRTPHAYLPVYDRSPRHIIGVIRVDELLVDGDWSVVADRLRPLTRFAPRVSVTEAITAMQEAGHPLATVTDHGGRMVGLVTMKGLLEEIVGDSSTS